MIMKGIYEELSITFLVVLCFLAKLSIGQTRTTINGRLPTENDNTFRSNTSQTEVNSGINIGESFFLNKLRQGDSEAITRLSQFQQTVDTPMTLLHNFFQVFSRPDLRQRNGVFGLLHNLAVARGLLPNSLAIGPNGLPIQGTTQRAVSTILPGNLIPVTTEMPLIRNEPRPSFPLNNRNIINTNTNEGFVTINGNINRLSNNLIGRSEETHSEEIIDPSISRTDRKSSALPSQTVSRNSISTSRTNVIFPSIDGRVSNGNINQRTPNLDRMNIGQRQVIQRDRIILDKDFNSVVTTSMKNNSNVRTTTMNPTRNFLVGGRFSSPSIRLQIRKQFPEDSSEQRGARILSNDLQLRVKNQTIHKTSKENNITNSLKQTTAFGGNVQQGNSARFKRPSKLNFMLEMPVGVTIFGRMGTIKSNDIRSNNTVTRSELESNKKLNESVPPKSKMNLNESDSDLLLKLTGKREKDEHNLLKNTLQTTNPNISLETEKDFILQRVGHIQLDPKDHVLQVVGEMNLSLAEPELNIQRVGDLNIGRRRQFIMDVRVNSSSVEDKVLLQRVGLTDLVPGERLQLHGDGDVRLLTRERVIIQRLGYISFQTDPLKVNEENEIGNQQSDRTDKVRSIFSIEPVVNVTLKPSLLFLGRETGAIRNENSNETVLQLVGDVLSEMPLDRFNMTHQNMSSFVQTEFNSTNVAETNTGDRAVSNNQSIPSSVRKGTLTVRDGVKDSILPVLRENVVLKSKQERIGMSNTPPMKIHLKSIGRIFSRVELKYENTRADSSIS